MFRIKICGITRTRDAELAIKLGADAIGLNFYAPSPRSISVEEARKISEVAHATTVNAPWTDHDTVTIVGVFVNASTEEINAIADAVNLDAIQLHGDEPSSQLTELRSRSRIRALRLQSEQDPIVAQVREEARSGILEAVLVDAFAPNLYGGSGKVAAWDLVPRLIEKWPECKTLLAGGLNPTNVAESIAVSKAYGVDVASGVEDQPGLKSETRLGEFIQQATAAFLAQG